MECPSIADLTIEAIINKNSTPAMIRFHMVRFHLKATIFDEEVRRRYALSRDRRLVVAMKSRSAGLASSQSQGLRLRRSHHKAHMRSRAVQVVCATCPHHTRPLLQANQRGASEAGKRRNSFSVPGCSPPQRTAKFAREDPSRTGGRRAGAGSAPHPASWRLLAEQAGRWTYRPSIPIAAAIRSRTAAERATGQAASHRLSRPVNVASCTGKLGASASFRARVAPESAPLVESACPKGVAGQSVRAIDSSPATPISSRSEPAAYHRAARRLGLGLR